MVVGILYENLSHRQIFLDGRELPRDPHPSFMGYSVGRWEDDTLVVETIGFKDTTWLDFGGHPHTEELRVVERYRRTAFGHIELKQTFEDPKVFSRPVTIDVKVDFVPDTEMLEYVCNENERDHARLVGKASDDKKNAVKVAREVLARYVGAYEFRATEDPNQIIVVNVTLVGDEVDARRRRQGSAADDSSLGYVVLNVWRAARIRSGRQGTGHSRDLPHRRGRPQRRAEVSLAHRPTMTVQV